MNAALVEYLRIINDRNVALRDNITDLADFEGQEPQYSLIPAETGLDTERVDDAVSPTVAALLALGLAAAVLTVALTGLAAWRELQRTIGDQQQWHQLGVVARARASIAALPILAGVAVGAAIAVPSAWLLDLGPQGLSAAMEPHPARRLVTPASTAPYRAASRPPKPRHKVPVGGTR